jgi:hypothetical protein
MLISAGIMRAILGAGILGMALLAIFYLRQRRMALREYLAWGLLAIFVPLFGPFWVIYTHPGQPAWPRQNMLPGRRRSRIWRRKRSLANWPKKWVTGR